MEITVEMQRFYVITRVRCSEEPATVIHKSLQDSWNDNAPSLRTVQHWIKQYREGDMKTFSDANRSGRPRTSTDNENQSIVKEAIEIDPFMSQRRIADYIQSNKSSVLRMLNEMGYRRLCGLWVPHLLTEEHKKQRIACAKDLKSNLESLNLDYFVVQDETWVYFSNPSKKYAYVPPGGDRPQITKFSPMTTQKTMLSIAFSPNGRFHLACLPYGKAIDSEELLKFFKRARELWGKRRKNPLVFGDMHLQFDNAPAHRSKVVKEYFSTAGATLINQSPYSPDYNLCDRFLFRAMKRHFKNLVFENCDDVLNAAITFMKDLSEEMILHEIDKLKLHCLNVIANHGDYVDCSKYNC